MGNQVAIISIQGTWRHNGGCRGLCGSPEQASNLPQGQAGDKEGAGRAEEQPGARHLPAPVHVPKAWMATACPANRGSSGVRRLGLSGCGVGLRLRPSQPSGPAQGGAQGQVSH